MVNENKRPEKSLEDIAKEFKLDSSRDSRKQGEEVLKDPFYVISGSIGEIILSIIEKYVPPSQIWGNSIYLRGSELGLPYFSKTTERSQEEKER